ncbi:MAG: hypothetical protein WCD20_17030 [Rhodomicrobium sp.]
MRSEKPFRQTGPCSGMPVSSRRSDPLANWTSSSGGARNPGLLQNATASSILEDMADEATAIDLNFLAKQMERLLKEAAALRRDAAKSIVLATQNLEFSRRIERRFGEVDERVSQMGRRIDELKDDFEVMLKAEVSGSLANFEDRVDAKISELGEELHPG